MANSIDEYRKTLIDLEQKVGEGFDKTLITLSGGALGVTITFIKDIAGGKGAIYPTYALTAWGMWAISLSSLLLAYYFGSLSYRYAIKQLDKGKLDPNNPGGIYASATNKLNVVGAISFILGVVLFVFFAYKNLGG